MTWARSHSRRPRATRGSATFTFKVLDQSAEASAAATATITVTDRNDGPIAPGAIPDQWATQGVPFTYTAPADLFTDADDDPLEWTAELRVSGDAQGSPVAGRAAGLAHLRQDNADLPRGRRQRRTSGPPRSA